MIRVCQMATAGTDTLPLHDALPIYDRRAEARRRHTSIRARRGIASVRAGRRGIATVVVADPERTEAIPLLARIDRKSTRLTSSHLGNSYAASCLKKKD